jgi:thiamine transport system substrate-binding protein
MKLKTQLILILLLLLLTACGPKGPTTLTVMTHSSFDASETVITAFEQANNVKVVFLKSGDAGEALSKAILSKDAPLADVFYGVDNTLLSRALEAGIYEAYDSPLLAQIPGEFQLDLQKRALPVDYGDVCLNYDKGYFTSHDLPIPATFDDLLKPEYKGLLVVENPATSSPGLAFMLATISYFGDPGYLDFWRNLRANEVLVVDGWEVAYNTEFTLRGGTRPIVVSYSSSPPFEVIYAATPMDEPPTGVITTRGTCFRQVEFVGILAGTKHRSLARKFVDYMLSREFQEDMPMKMYMFPVNPAAKLDETFVKFLANPEEPAFVSPGDIAANRTRWVAAWADAVLR